jgi:hypothetical protein
MALPLFFAVFFINSCSPVTEQEKTPLIYVTDLYHPYEDLDDHFDIASIYSLSQFDIKFILIDNAKPFPKTPGRIPVEQLNYIHGKEIPIYLGLKDPLKSVEDTGENQISNKEGINAILYYLKNSNKKLTIISIGSLRDIAAAYNKDPILFENKVEKLIIFIGEANNEEFMEYNASLDKYAYIKIMNNAPNVWWVPCFDGGSWQNNGNGSYWQGHHSDLLEGASDQIVNYFLYAMVKSSDSVNYIQNLNLPVNKDDFKSQILDASIQKRNLWCASIFPFFVEEDQSKFPFTFEQVSVNVDSNAVVHYIDKGNSLMRFSITDKLNYEKRMNNIFNDIIKQ